ncbi:MAG: hypothetical protein JSS86_10180 [Cyanobacteria bacterium SZAS LIN-2]|nr:hypothetical protein [Cyanobacteria bacterium SZAS LIN-3]MBS1996670.1 hypothetical protein [Cyanobacteria bacterium SZAS LIN-2]MBS2006811.1 hypothetical protein [Cyanobacteria bacterium SZAS TMP-1]
MAFRHITLSLSLVAAFASTGLSCGAGAADGDLLALNAPIHTASDPALRQAVELLSKTPKVKAGQGKRGNFNTQPANDATVVKHRKDLDKVLILGGAEVIPM